MRLEGKKVVVAGAGKSGIAAAKLLLATGSEVVVFDQNEACDADKIRKELASDTVEVWIGTLKEEELDGVAAMVLSPGISIEAPFTEAFRTRNIPIWSEVELAYQYGKGRLAAITGTNGKTTTTSLTGEIMKAYYDSVFVVGNIGTPYTECTQDMTEQSVTVAEISSFQLESIIDFHPNVSAVLNVTPDHLNRHHTMEIYADTKMSIAKNQTKDEVIVLNYDDPITKEMAGKVTATPVYFSRKELLDDGVCLEDDAIVLREKGQTKEVFCRLEELKLLGSHNVENVMAAAAISYYMQVPVEKIHEVVTTFMGVEHRIEYVDTVDGVDYYNDSKGTNPDAAIKGIQAMVKPTLLIGGGYDKGVAFDDWIEAFDGRVRYLVLMGVTAEMIKDTAIKHGFTDIIMVENLKEAVEVCAKKAQPGDAVLLSPACASWDMFDSYEQRGELFKQYVREL